jgi:Lar family restriction alleviation protein
MVTSPAAGKMREGDGGGRGDMDEQPKDCPFCGGEGQQYEGTADEAGERHFVECVQCGARSGIYATEEDALKAWQMRAA